MRSKELYILNFHRGIYNYNENVNIIVKTIERNFIVESKRELRKFILTYNSDIYTLNYTIYCGLTKDLNDKILLRILYNAFVFVYILYVYM